MIFEPSSENLNELFTALAKAQAEILTAIKSNDNPFYKSKFADLASVVSAARPALVKNNLCVIQNIIEEDDGTYLYTILGHSSGQFMCGRKKMTPKNNDNAGMGGAITYFKRYAYSAMVGVVTCDEDDDGQSADKEEVMRIRPNDKDLGTGKPTDAQLYKINQLIKQYPEQAAALLSDPANDLKKLNITTASDLIDKLKGDKH